MLLAKKKKKNVDDIFFLLKYGWNFLYEIKSKLENTIKRNTSKWVMIHILQRV